MAKWVKLTDSGDLRLPVWINLDAAKVIHDALISIKPDVVGAVVVLGHDNEEAQYYVVETPEQIFKAAYIVPGDPRTPTERIPENGR